MAMLDVLEKGVNSWFASIPRERPAQRMVEKACLIAHRGVHGKNSQSIENTDEAFAKAAALGCWGIEMDVHATADQVIIVNHDATLTRLWGKDAAIKDITFEQLRQLAPKVPSLAEVVARYGRQMHLFIELKAPFTAQEALLLTLQPLIPEKDYHLLSLDEQTFAKLSSFPRQSMLLVAGHNNTAQLCKLSLQKNYGGVLGHYLLLNDAKILKLQTAMQKVGIGFVDSKFSLYRELNRGLEWVISNNIEQISLCLQELRLVSDS